MATSHNVIIRDVVTDESMGRLSWQTTAAGRRPVPAGRAFPILATVIRRSCHRNLHRKNVALRLEIMRRTFAIGMTFLVMLWAASPALACLLPGRAMTAAEHACCKQMAERCGSPNMPQSHSCCQKEVQPGTASIVVSHHQSAPAPQVLMVGTKPSSSFELSGTIFDRVPSHSPPDSSVLRI
jgi:hypothetical protein